MDLINVLDYCTNLIHGVSGGGIPDAVGNLIHLAFVLIQVVVPILLIIWGMIDFAQAVIAQDEDKIKAGQKKFMKRLIAALVIFLIVTIVQLAINVVASLDANSADPDSAWKCAKSLINGKQA